MLTTLASCVAVFAATAIFVWFLLEREPPSQRLFDWASGLVFPLFILVALSFTMLKNDETIRLYYAHLDRPSRPFEHGLAVLAGGLFALQRLGGVFAEKGKKIGGFSMVPVILLPATGIFLIGNSANSAANMAVHANWTGFLQDIGVTALCCVFLVMAVVLIRRKLDE